MTISMSDLEQLLQQEKRKRTRAEMMEKSYRAQSHAYVTHIEELNTIQRALILTIATLQKELEEAKARLRLRGDKGMTVLNDLQSGLRGFGADCGDAISELNPRETEEAQIQDRGYTGDGQETLRGT